MTSPHRSAHGALLAHGMDAGLAIPDWPALTLAELQDLAPRYAAMGGPLQVTWHSPRPFSAAARVRAGQGEVFVKRHDARVRDVAGLLEEHAFIGHLQARGFGVSRVLANREQLTATAMGGCVYEVHAIVAGEDCYRDVHSWVPAHDAADAWAMGSALARLHAAGRGFAQAPRPPRPLLAGIDIVGAHDLPGAVQEFLCRRPAVAAFLEETGAAQELIERMAPWHAPLRPLLASLEPAWAHNDWHASNLFWVGAPGARTVCAAIDFGLSNRGWAVSDLATALERNTIAWLEAGANIARPVLAQALIAGYCAERPLSAVERLALPLVLPIAHVEYALSEVDYFHGIVHNEANARLACPKFLLGHLAWFGGEEGAAYLNAVRQCLAVPRPSPPAPVARALQGAGATPAPSDASRIPGSAPHAQAGGRD